MTALLFVLALVCDEVWHDMYEAIADLFETPWILLPMLFDIITFAEYTKKFVIGLAKFIRNRMW